MRCTRLARSRTKSRMLRQGRCLHLSTIRLCSPDLHTQPSAACLTTMRGKPPDQWAVRVVDVHHACWYLTETSSQTS